MILLIVVAGFLLLEMVAHAEIPQLINYQGVLTTISGAPINGTVSLTFSIYDVSTGGTALWAETQSVNVTNGLFNVLLGSVVSVANVFNGNDRWLGINVVGDPGGEMIPRNKLVSVGYALTAGQLSLAFGTKAYDQNSRMVLQANGDNTAFLNKAGNKVLMDMRTITTNGRDTALISGGISGTKNVAFLGDTGGNGDVLIAYGGPGKVGIGTTIPSEKLDVNGNVRANAFLTSSSKELKKQITPLSHEDYQDILKQINGLQMVRFLYKHEQDRHLHLGVIAEDSPQEIVDEAGTAVSLYDYTSFLLAGLKAQSDEIEALKAKIRDLEAKVAK